MKEQLEALIAQAHQSGLLYPEFIREAKKRYILHVLEQCKGNQCQAARLLRMHRNTLTRTVNELKLWKEVREIRTGRPTRRRPARSAIAADHALAS